MDKLKQIRLATRTRDGKDYEPDSDKNNTLLTVFVPGFTSPYLLFCHGALN